MSVSKPALCKECGLPTHHVVDLLRCQLRQFRCVYGHLQFVALAPVPMPSEQE